MRRRRLRPGAALAALVLPLAVPLAIAPAAPAVADDCVRLVIEGRELPVSSTQCLQPSRNGIDLLRNGGHSLRLNSSGLLCAIDGQPATGCGEPASGGGYQFWSYWTASGGCSWSFSNRGPSARSFSTRPAADGWVWVNGGGQASRPPSLPACTSEGASGASLADETGRASAQDESDSEDTALVGTESDGLSPSTVLGVLTALSLGGLAAVVTRRRRTNESAIG